MSDFDMEFFAAPGAPNTPLQFEFDLNQSLRRGASINAGPGGLHDFHRYYSESWTAPLARATSLGRFGEEEAKIFKAFVSDNLAPTTHLPRTPSSASLPSVQVTDEDNRAFETFIQEISQPSFDFSAAVNSGHPTGLVLQAFNNMVASSATGHQIAPPAPSHTPRPQPFTAQRLMRNTTILDVPLEAPQSVQPATQQSDWSDLFQETLPRLEDLSFGDDDEWDDEAAEEELEVLKTIAFSSVPHSDLKGYPLRRKGTPKFTYTLKIEDENMDDSESDAATEPDTDVGECSRTKPPSITPQTPALSRAFSGASETGSLVYTPSQLVKRKLAVMIESVDTDPRNHTPDTESDSDQDQTDGGAGKGPKTRSRAAQPARKRRRFRLYDSTSPLDEARYFCKWSDPVTGVRCGTGFSTSPKLVLHLASTHVQKEIDYVNQGLLKFTDAVALILITYHHILNGLGEADQPPPRGFSSSFGRLLDPGLIHDATTVKTAIVEGKEICWDQLEGFQSEMRQAADMICKKLTCIDCGRRAPTQRAYARHRQHCQGSPTKSGLKKDKAFRREPNTPKVLRWSSKLDQSKM